MASKMIAMVMIPPAGMPAAPTLDAVAVTLQQGQKNSFLLMYSQQLRLWANDLS